MNKQKSTARIDWMITLVPLALILALCVLFFFLPEQSNAVLSQIRFFFGDTFGLYYLIIGLGIFGLSLFLSPIFLAIPSFATAPALIMVGFLMLTSITKIDFSDYTEAIPCFIAIIAMPFMYSISEGIAMGVISYVVLNVATGKAKEKKISILMYVLAVLFILKYVVL